MTILLLFRGLFVFTTLTVITSAPGATRPLATGPSLVDGDDRTGDDAHMDGGLQSVWLGTRGVAVWASWSPEKGMRLMGTTFGADGSSLQGPPVELTGALPFASLSACGNELLLVWQDPPVGVLARRMAPDLTWLDPAPTVLLPPYYFNTLPYARSLYTAANAERHGVLVVDPSTTVPTLYFIRMGPSTSPALEVVPIDTADSGYILNGALTARPDGFLLTWTGYDTPGASSTIYARTISSSGPASGSLQSWATERKATGTFMAAAPLGGGYAVTWTEIQSPGESNGWELSRRLRRLDANGVPVAATQDSFPADVNSDPQYPSPYPVTLHSVNGGLLAFSVENVPGYTAPYRRVIRRAISADGTLGEVRRFGETQAMAPESTFVHDTSSGLMAVGQVKTSSVYSYRQSVAAESLTAGSMWSEPSHLLSPGIPEQQACAVACRGTDYLVVWQDGRDGHVLAAEIRGRFVALDGTFTGPSFRISNTPSDDISPAVAASGGKYLVAWSSSGGVKAAFVTAPGTASAAFPVSSQAHGVSVAGGPNGGFFAAWRAYVPGNDDDIFGAWIDGNGTTSPVNGFPVGVSPLKERAVAVAGGASTYGVVWRDGNSRTATAYGAIVPGSPVAAPVTPDKVVFAPGVNLAHAPEIAWNGSQYRVVWYENDYNAVRSATLSESGAKGETIPLPDAGITPAIVARSGGWEIFSHYGGVSFASVDAAGQMTNSGRFAGRYVDADTLSAAAAPDGGVLIVYPTSRINGSEPAGTAGVFSGGIEAVLFYPDRTAAGPGLSISAGGGSATLGWNLDPYFPLDARLLETSTDLQEWLPGDVDLTVKPVPAAGNRASLTFPVPAGARRYFRLNSGAPALQLR